MSIERICVIGLGGVGGLVATMCRDGGMDVRGLDIRRGPTVPDGIDFITGDAANPSIIAQALAGCDAVVCCLPYHRVLEVARAAHAAGVHYFDPTEDVTTTTEIRDMAKTSEGVMIPQNGLAPGFIGILGASLAKQFDETGLRHLRLRVGALPQNPIGQMGYSGNWSLHGLVHECIADCQVIIDGKLRTIRPLRNPETIRIFGQEFEAFSTSGGLGTLTETFAGRTESLNYKSIRYPGHLDCMRLLLEELRFNHDPDALVRLLGDALPPDDQDRVLIHASVQGTVDERMHTKEIVADYRPVEVDGKMRTAIVWTTAASIVAVIELVSSGQLPQQGFVKQEDIELDWFLQTRTGSLYAEHHPNLGNPS